jgi:hypothetical protein
MDYYGYQKFEKKVRESKMEKGDVIKKKVCELRKAIGRDAQEINYAQNIGQ